MPGTRNRIGPRPKVPVLIELTVWQEGQVDTHSSEVDIVLYGGVIKEFWEILTKRLNLAWKCGSDTCSTAMCLMYDFFNSHNDKKIEVPESLNSLPKVTWLGSGRAGS